MLSNLIQKNNFGIGSKNTDIRTAIDFMMKEGIRNIGIKESADNNDSSNNNKAKLLRIINDRKVVRISKVIMEGKLCAETMLQL